MGDADCSYDFMDLMPFLERLRAGTELVVGNRFLGGIGKGAMPPLHRYLGNPVLCSRRPDLLLGPDRRLPLRPSRLPPRRVQSLGLTRRAWNMPRR